MSNSVYGRLGYNFNTTQFNGADNLTTGVSTYLKNSSINLSQWQINDIANTSATGYYQNPHQYTLANLSIYLNGIATIANSNNTTFNVAPNGANTLNTALNTLLPSIISFTTHTNNLSGLTRSSDASLYPDLQNALAIGRQILNITNATDAIQNNTPILGNFTSLYIANTINALSISITNDYNTLNASLTIVSGNTYSNISNTAMNVIISHVQTLQTTMDTQRTNDYTFYQNSLAVLKDYQTVSQFSNIGATQNSLITIIGSSKLHSELGF